MPAQKGDFALFGDEEVCNDSSIRVKSSLMNKEKGACGGAPLQFNKIMQAYFINDIFQMHDCPAMHMLFCSFALDETHNDGTYNEKIEQIREVLHNKPIVSQHLYPEGTDVSDNTTGTDHLNIRWFLKEVVEGQFRECA